MEKTITEFLDNWRNAIDNFRKNKPEYNQKEIFRLIVLDIWQKDSNIDRMKCKVDQATVRYSIVFKSGLDLFRFINILSLHARNKNAAFLKYYYRPTSYESIYMDCFSGISRNNISTQQLVEKIDVEKDIRNSLRYIKNK